ncbi:MAG: tail fiber domain-containing protein [Bacteroidota bacterium]
MKTLLTEMSQKLFILIFVAFSPAIVIAQGVVVTEEGGEVADPHESSIFEIRSTDKGLLIPSMTSIQRENISNPANGLLIFDIDESQFFYYDASANEGLGAWVKAIGPQGPEGYLEPGTEVGNTPYWDGDQWVLSSNNLFHDGTNVGIGSNLPESKLHIEAAGTSPLQILSNIEDQSASLSFITPWYNWRIGQNRPPEMADLADAFYIYDANSNSTRFIINTLGNVGINTNPTERLDVNGNLRLRGNLFDVNNSSGTSGQVLLRGTSGVTWADYTGGIGGSGSGAAGKIAYWENATDIAPLPFMNYTGQFVEVTSKEAAADEDPIFEVRNKDGLIVFGVYQTGVRIYVDDSIEKTARGGFAVGGFTSQKEKLGVEYLRVTPDSVRVYVDATDNPAKTARGGFAVGGFTSQKGFQELLRVTQDSTRVYVNDSPGKTARGGFAVGGFTSVKSIPANFMHLTPENYFIGHQSGEFITTGTKNTFFGYNSGNKTSSGTANIFIGEESGFNNTEGIRNIFIGYRAGKSNVGIATDPTVGHDNIYLGTNAGRDNPAGEHNTFVGSYSGYLSLGTKNTFYGAFTGLESSGMGNVFVGLDAGRYNLSGDYNVFLGAIAGMHNTGEKNTYLGYAAGWTSTAHTRSGNVFIGHLAGVGETGSNKLYIANDSGTPLIYGDFSAGRVGLGTTSPGQKLTVAGNIRLQGGNRWLYFNGGDGVIQVEDDTKQLWFYTGGAYRMVLRNNGNLGLNTNNPTTTLHVNHPSGTSNGLSISVDGHSHRWHFYNYSTGNLALFYNGSIKGSFNYESGAYSALSDKRLKTNITTAGSLLDKVLMLNVSEYNFVGQKSEKRYMGLIAQDVQTIFPHLVSYVNAEKNNEEADYYTLDYSGIGVIAIKAIQEQNNVILKQQEVINAQQNKINELQEKSQEIDELKIRLEKLEKLIDKN